MVCSMITLLHNWNRESCEQVFQEAHSNWEILYEPHPIPHHNDPTFNKHVDIDRFRVCVLNQEPLRKLLLDLNQTIEMFAGHPLKQISAGVVRWDPGTFMAPHVDNPAGWFRDYAAIVYLNDNFEGGVFEFTNLELQIKPKQGHALMFSCDQQRHGVSEITAGVRYTLSCWYQKTKR